MEKYMERYKETVSMLMQDAANLFCSLEKLKSSNSQSASVIEKDIDDYLCELEVLCLKSRVLLDGYKQVQVVSDSYTTNTVVSDIAGEIEVTHEGWLHIRLNTLLPNCKYRISNYIGDTIAATVCTEAVFLALDVVTAGIAHRAKMAAKTAKNAVKNVDDG